MNIHSIHVDLQGYYPIFLIIKPAIKRGYYYLLCHSRAEAVSQQENGVVIDMSLRAKRSNLLVNGEIATSFFLEKLLAMTF